VQEAKISLCLVRRANRDGHVMRTFEAAVSGACMLVEYTDEHREIFGHDGDCVLFFKNFSDLVARAKWLINHPEERIRLRKAVFNKIHRDGCNSYFHRLKYILKNSFKRMCIG
jgi:spore maturation protein CgeB